MTDDTIQSGIMKRMFSLEGQTAIVTGAATGIGESVAIVLQAQVRLSL